MTPLRGLFFASEIPMYRLAGQVKFYNWLTVDRVKC
jgi:hypothetical protein